MSLDIHYPSLASLLLPTFFYFSLRRCFVALKCLQVKVIVHKQEKKEDIRLNHDGADYCHHHCTAISTDVVVALF